MIAIRTYMRCHFLMMAVHWIIFPCAFRSRCVHVFTYLLYRTTIPDALLVTLTQCKTHDSAIRPEISQWFSHTTRSPLLFLFLIYVALLSLTVATVIRCGDGTVTCRQAGRRQKSVYLMELELLEQKNEVFWQQCTRSNNLQAMLSYHCSTARWH